MRGQLGFTDGNTLGISAGFGILTERQSNIRIHKKEKNECLAAKEGQGLRKRSAPSLPVSCCGFGAAAGSLAAPAFAVVRLFSQQVLISDRVVHEKCQFG